MASIPTTEKKQPEQEDNELDKTGATSPEETQEGTDKGEKEVSEAEVPLTEEFQMQVMELIKDATKEQLSFIRDMAYQRDEELRNEKEVTVYDFNEAKESQD